MNDFKRLNELVAAGKDELNAMYRQLDNPSQIVLKMLKIAGFKGEKSEKVAVLRRIVDLKVEPLENELKKQGREEAEIGRIKDEAFELVREFYEARFEKLLARVKEEKILDEFYLALLSGMHGAGVAMNAWQSAWDRQILQTTNKEFEAKFASMAEAIKFIDENRLYQKDGEQKGERSYGAVLKNGEKYAFAPYAVAFENEVKRVADALEELIKNLKSLAANDEHEAYLKYFEKLKAAFCERENDRTIPAWQDAERAWMDVKGPLQPGHPLEYYEDAYTHAVALEWDVRLAGASDFDEEKFKASVIRAYEQICRECGIEDAQLACQVTQNVARTQTYISVPMIYYGAELNGLFSAQVVPNDETVSKERGKKIFAFVEHVYESAKARPFMKLSGEIFSREFLDYGREILFKKPQIWKKTYEISTIGHEFGHILFVGTDTEKAMNSDGEFKFIEEYKATTGGLVNFFIGGDKGYEMSVFHELIARAVGLIAWREVDEVRAYYCEGLIHLSLLFDSGTLSFEGGALVVKFDREHYAKFKEICLANYKNLALHYARRAPAGEFLAKFCEKEGKSYLPKHAQARAFVEHYYARYKAIGNELDESGEWEKWQAGEK